MFKLKEKAESEPKKRHNSVVVAKTLDHTQAEEKITSRNLTAKGDLLHWEINFAKNCEEDCQEVPIGSRRRTCDRVQGERSNLGNCLYNTSKDPFPQCESV